MANLKLVKFIREARKRGFSELQIRKPLVEKGWLLNEIDAAFYALNPKPKFKNKIELFLDSEVINLLEKRAKKNLMTLPEQIEDILRRSCSIQLRKTRPQEKLDDLLVSIFSRRKKGRK